MRCSPFALALGLMTVTAAIASAQEADCEITLGGKRIDGPCNFVARQGGSFDINMIDGGRIGDAPTLSLDVTGKGVGTLRGSDGKVWGRAERQADGACWATDNLTVCARAAKGQPTRSTRTGPEDPPQQPVPEPTEAERQRSFGARCHMGGCAWYIQDTPVEIGKGSTAIPGRRLKVDERSAYGEYPDAYPEYAPPGLSWSKDTFEVFCSTTRPAFYDGDGNWMVLPLPQIFGATEGVSTRYLKACHPGIGNDPYEAVKSFGYQSTADQRDTYPSFEALTTR